MADQDKNQDLTDHQTKPKQKLRGIATTLTAFCTKNQVIEFNYARSQSKYPVLHWGTFNGTGFLFFGRLGSRANTEKKGYGPIMSNFLGWFFHVFRGKKIFFFLFFSFFLFFFSLKSCIKWSQKKHFFSYKIKTNTSINFQ